MKEKFELEMEQGFQELEQLALCNENYKLILDNMAKLHDEVLKEERMELEKEKERKFREKEKFDKKMKLAEVILPTTISLVSLYVNVQLIKKGFQFEETGTIRSKTMNKIFSPKILK